MPTIRHVCISDLHLGASNSVLTHLDAEGVHVDGPAPVLEAVLGALRDLLAASETSTPPALVVHGDLFELALTSVEVAAASFAELVAIGWGDPSGPLFADRAYFVPGNHDHHMWELMREHAYEADLGPTLADVGPMPHVTPMRVENLPDDEREPLVEVLARLALAGTDARAPSFQVAYPNLGLVDEERDRAVVVTHGHYLEPMYRAMTYLHNVVIPSRPPRLSVDQVEKDNWAWIDFFWSTMGRSGEADDAAVPVLYELMQHEGSMDAIVDRVVDDLLPARRSPLAAAERAALRRVGRRVARRIARRERHQAGLLSPDAAEGLTNYLAGPVRGQLCEEVGHVPGRVDLVFGHTHKPFAARSRPAGFPGEVVAHNTGGWVVDSVEPEPLKGAALSLISDELEVVDLCIYRQQAGARPPRVTVMAVPGPSAGPTPLRDWLVARLRADAGPWADVADATDRAVRERQCQLDTRIARGTEAVRGTPAGGPRGW